MYRQFKKVDHIDPLKHNLICGLDLEINCISSDKEYNLAKSNAFVPYRVNSYNPPQKFGDVGEFLIDNIWTICSFGGNKWWKEAKKLGYSRTNRRKSFWIHNELSGKEMMIKDDKQIPKGFIKGRNKSKMDSNQLKNFGGIIKGKKAFFNKKTYELKYFNKNPDIDLWEEGLPPNIRNNMSLASRPSKRPDIESNIQHIISLYDSGMSTTHLAKLFNTNHRTISLLLSKNGIELRRRAANKAEREKSKRLYEQAIGKAGTCYP